jgi:hypothetical protein
MLKDLTPDQLKLCEYMSDLSEDAYCAGWMDGLEYALWEALLGLRGAYGWLELTKEQKEDLRVLSEKCGGWIIFDDEKEETWVAASDWERRFSAWKGSGKRAD